MKLSTLILMVVSIGLSIDAKSQFTKGQKFTGGNANISFISGEWESANNPAGKSRSFSIFLTPRFSWVTKENQMMGVLLGSGYSYSRSFTAVSKDYQTNKTVRVNAGYFLRHYSTFNQHVGWFMEYNINANYNKGTSNYVNACVDHKSKGENYGAEVLVYPGFYYKMSPRTLIEASFGGLYGSYSKSKNETSKGHQISIGANFPTNLSLGVQFLLGNKL